VSATGATPTVRLAYVVGTYPHPTTTFIDREIRQLRAMGADVRIVSLRHPDGALSHEQRELQVGVTYALPATAPGLLRSHVWAWLRHPAATASTLASLVTGPHPSLSARLRTVGHWGLGVHVGRLIHETGPVDNVHAHFVDRAATVAMVAARLLGRPYSATAHALDIYVDPILLPDKLARAKFVATCTRYNERHLLAVAEDGQAPAVRCIYHGLDLHGYEPVRDGTGGVPSLISVGQLTERKGLPFLLDACAILVERGIRFTCAIVGDGPDRAVLERRRDDLGLAEHVRFLGALPHDEVIARYAEAAVFVLPCVMAKDGGRDGIPNVILEAMAMALPVVSTRHSGIPEAVQEGVTGLLVEPEDAPSLADAIATLLADPALRARLGAAGRERAADTFDVTVNVRRLFEEFVA